MKSADAGVTVGVVAYGNPLYHAAASETVASALDHTDASVVIVTDAGYRPPSSGRIAHLAELGGPAPARRFLIKLDAWRRIRKAASTEVLCLLDADAVFVTPVSTADLVAALGEHEFALAEQTRLHVLGWRRSDYREHYASTTLKYVGSEARPPAPEDFRFFNSGVVLCRRGALEEFLDWAEPLARRTDFESASRNGVTLTDQDFLQFWLNQLHPYRARTLGWSWNHGPHWDDGFPRDGARVVHFSDFYHPPTDRIVEAMRMARNAALHRE